MCDEREPLLAYLYDEADATERQRVEAHLSTCERCRDELAGLQSVREDLLAWNVPDHESVWKPFVPVRPVWSWRDVPVWSLATAALVMLALGAAGGVLTSTWIARRAPVTLAAQASPASAVSATPISVITPADLAALEQRVLAASQRREQATATRAGLTSTEYDELLKINQEQLGQLGRVTQRMNDLSAKVDAMVAQAQQGGR